MPMLRVVTSTLRYENPWMRVREDVFLRPDGTEGLYGVVEKRDFACIVPWDGTHLWLVEQYRLPVDAWSLELPQGSWDPGQAEGSPEQLARMELREETGCEAGQMAHQGRLWQACGASTQSFDVWLATSLEAGEASPGIDEHGLRSVRMTPDEVDAAVDDGRIRDSASVASLALLARRGGLPA